MRQTITSPRIPAPHFRYSPCVVSGGIGFVSGMVALDPATGELIPGDVGAQTQRILDNLCLALPDYGFTLEQLCLARIYTTRMDRFGDINAVWSRLFEQRVPPARTSVGVSELPLGAAVEMEFLFHRGEVNEGRS